MVHGERGPSWSGDEEARDWGRLSRLAVWGASAALAVALAAMASQSDIGIRRLADAISGLSKTAMTPQAPVASTSQLKMPPFDAEAETRRLSETVSNLTADRDRLLARVAGLERSLDEVNSSVARLTGPAPDAATAKATPVPPPPEPAAAPAPQSGARAPVASRPTSLQAITTGSIPPAEPSAPRAEFGADIGSASTMDGLRTLWSVVRSNYPHYFDRVRPIVSVRETRSGTLELRLIVGPLADSAAAARLCANLVTAGLECQAAAFEGQRLATR